MLKRILFSLFVLILLTTTFLTATAEATEKKTKTESIKETGNSTICLTFDDGFNEKSIEAILDCLKENEIISTFFVIGTCLELYQELWQRAISEGHEVCYHTMYHQNLTKKTNKQILNDLEKWNNLAKEILGENYTIPKLARLPGGNGHHSQRILDLFDEQDYQLIYWSADTYTGAIRGYEKVKTSRITKYVLRHTKEGTILLQHFNYYDSKALPEFIVELKEKFKITTVSKALEENNKPLPRYWYYFIYYWY